MRKQIGETVYRIDSKGKVRQWSIFVEEKSDGAAEKITETGLVDGAKIESGVLITKGKNIGKSNETSPLQQCLSEAEADYTQALRKGYSVGIENATAETSGSGNVKPMLAQKFDPTMKQKDSKNLEKLGIVGVPAALQPKKDGNRCNPVITKPAEGENYGKVKLITRKGDEFLPIPHVEENLSHLGGVIHRILAAEGFFAPKDTIVIDGELMSSVMTFNQLNGLLKKRDKSPEQLELLKTVKLHIYDVMLPIGYRERYTLLEKALGINAELAYPELRLIENDFVDALSYEIINEKLEYWLEQEEEGLMIRLLDTPYEHKRTWQLMKYKNFQDDEYEILDLEPDVKGNLGKFVCKPHGTIFNRDGKQITEFRAGTRGISHEEGREMLANKEQYIGKMGTIRYQLTSEYGVPRFGKFVGIRDDI